MKIDGPWIFREGRTETLKIARICPKLTLVLINYSFLWEACLQKLYTGNIMIMFLFFSFFFFCSIFFNVIILLKIYDKTVTIVWYNQENKIWVLWDTAVPENFKYKLTISLKITDWSCNLLKLNKNQQFDDE